MSKYSHYADATAVFDNARAMTIPQCFFRNSLAKNVSFNLHHVENAKTRGTTA